MLEMSLAQEVKNIFNLIGGELNYTVKKNNVTASFQRVDHLTSPSEPPGPSEVYGVPNEGMGETG